MRVCMIPRLANFANNESGIKRVVEAYEKYGKQYGIEYVNIDDGYDLMAIHAGISTYFDDTKPLISHCHGMYWSADYPSNAWELRANRDVIATLRRATIITVPSDWVAETIRRDMHIDPIVIHHGVDWDEWQHNLPVLNYVIWNKNRNADVCDPFVLGELARKVRDIVFLTTFLPPNPPDNIQEIGIVPHSEMKKIVQQAAIYLSTTKETFGIGALEAMAAGTPVVGYAYGGNLITVQHGVNGYLAKPGDVDDLARGIWYCLKYRDILSSNARETAKKWNWEKAIKKVAETYQMAIDIFNDKKRPRQL